MLVNVGAKGAGVVAFDPATGKEVWKDADEPASYSSPGRRPSSATRGPALFFTRNGLPRLFPSDGACAAHRLRSARGPTRR